MNKLTSLVLIVLVATVAVASESDIKELDRLNEWQWTKDHEVCDSVLQADQVEMLSPGARAKYDKQLKAAVEGYDVWEAERQKHLSALTDAERKTYKAKCEKLEAEMRANDTHRFEFDKRRAKEVAEKLALARQQLAAISSRAIAPEEPAMNELLKEKIARLDEINKWIWAPWGHLRDAVNAFKKLDATSSSSQKELAKFRVMSALLDLEGETREIDAVLATMSKEDRAAYDSTLKERAEVQRAKDPHGFGRNAESSGAQAKLVEEAKTITGL